MTNEEKFKLAKLRILNIKELQLFGCIYYKFTTEILNSNEYRKDIPEEFKSIFKQKLTAFVQKKPEGIYLGIFDSFIENHLVEELTFALIHEIMHVLNWDLIASDLNQEILNLAQDHVINLTIEKDIQNGKLIKVKMPNWVFIIDDLRNKNYTTMEVYNYLIDNAKVTNTFNKHSIVKFKDTDHMVQVPIGPTDGNIEQSIKDINSDAKNMQAELRSIIENNIIKGDKSSSVYQFIKDVIAVEIPWYKILEKCISSKSVRSNTSRSWKEPRKKYRHLGITLPGPGREKIRNLLIILEDVSASISTDNLKKFSDIILKSLFWFNEIRIIQHDSKIKSDVTLSKDDLSAEDIIYSIKGRGGTSHKYPFQAIQKEYEDSEDISLIIMLTDFESDIERLWPKFKWTKDIPVVMVLTKDYTIPKEIDSEPILIK